LTTLWNYIIEYLLVGIIRYFLHDSAFKHCRHLVRLYSLVELAGWNLNFIWFSKTYSSRPKCFILFVKVLAFSLILILFYIIFRRLFNLLPLDRHYGDVVSTTSRRCMLVNFFCRQKKVYRKSERASSNFMHRFISDGRELKG